MDAVILGASGLVGSHLLDEAGRRGIAALGTSRNHPRLQRLDVTDHGETERLLATSRPRVVLMAAAFANVDACERDPATAAQVNVNAPRHVAAICREIGALLVYYSTDYVFDGTHGPYGEDESTRPVSQYGAQKAAAEVAVRDHLPGAHLILRTTVVYGSEPAGKNFLIRLLQNLRQGTAIRVPVDQVGSPTFVDDLAAASWELVAAGARGTFNVAGPERMDRREFALRAARAFDLDPSPIIGVRTSELSQLAVRPLNAGLRVDKVEALLGRRMVAANDALRELAGSGAL
jgi:dTDP-4-dehydrorhamnose reductase